MNALISGVIGLLGVAVGAYLTHRWQRRQWILDSKKAEYGEFALRTVSEHRANGAELLRCGIHGRTRS